MNSLDMHTSIFIFVFLSFICTLVIALMWLQYRIKFKGFKYFFMNFLLQSIGLTLEIFRGNIHPVITVIVPNFLIITGVVLFMFGIACFLDLIVKRNIYYIYILFFTALYSYFTVVQPDIRIRIILFTILTIPIFLNVIYLIFVKSDLENRKNALGVGIVCILFIVMNILRFYYVVTGGEIKSYANTPLTDTLFVIFCEALTVMMTFSIILMVVKKLFYQVVKYNIERETILQEMQLLATMDALTNIYNRRKIEELMLFEVERFQRYQIPFSIILADIDHFKRFNDTYGHDVGDEALMDVARLLGENIRKFDYIGRWGGEEFLIILPGIKLHEASITAEKLRTVIEEYNPDYLNKGDRISISMGVIEYTQDMDVKSVFKEVDMLLYKAKSNGRNRVEVYEC